MRSALLMKSKYLPKELYLIQQSVVEHPYEKITEPDL